MLSKKNTLSVVILTHNSARTITLAIKSIHKIALEIIIIDDWSTDETLKLARKFKSKIFRRALNSNFSEQRNFGLSKASGDWILFLDSDEIVSEKLALEILNKIKATKAKGFNIVRLDDLWGKDLKFGESGSTTLLRLARSDSGKWRRAVHEYWDIKGKTLKLDNFITHNPHPTVSEFLTNINKYSRIHSQENKREGKKSSLVKIIFWPIGKFFLYYVVRLGFLDGLAGFIYAVFMSFHSFLAWSELWIQEND